MQQPNGSSSKKARFCILDLTPPQLDLQEEGEVFCEYFIPITQRLTSAERKIQHRTGRLNNTTAEHWPVFSFSFPYCRTHRPTSVFTKNIYPVMLVSKSHWYHIVIVLIQAEDCKISKLTQLTFRNKKAAYSHSFLCFFSVCQTVIFIRTS